MPESYPFLYYLWLKLVYMGETALPFLLVILLILLVMYLSNQGHPRNQ